MGSLLESYLKQRDLRNFLRSQECTIACQLSAVDEQVGQILDEGTCPRSELANSAYLHGYLIGILDSITNLYERETRRRLGLELYREVFVRYLRDRFFLSRHQANGLFDSASRDLNGATKRLAMRDGYADGLLAMRGERCCRRLLSSFTAETPDRISEPVMVAGFAEAAVAAA